ncbi:MAG: tetratricopeptide repeat protein [Saprospiraceae bacterium]|nr:tetratricopeptide repeat protein [Saprospiraceae bacterium]
MFSAEYYRNLKMIMLHLANPQGRGFIFVSSLNQGLIPYINNALKEEMRAKGRPLSIVELKEGESPLQTIQRAASDNPNHALVINFLDILIITKGTEVLQSLNYGRENLNHLNVPILFWASESTRQLLANQAIDLYSQRRFADITFEDAPLSIVRPSLESHFDTEFKTTEEYENIRLHITLLESQLEEAKASHISDKSRAQPSESKYLASPPMLLAADIIGRETELRDLKRLIMSWQGMKQLRGAKPVVVSGEGGLGKTTLVKGFCEEHGHLFNHIVYLTMNAVFKPEHDALAANEALFLDAFVSNEELVLNLNLSFEPTADAFTRFQMVVAKLNTCSGRNLLVIDNMAAVPKRIWERLHTLRHWTILMTAREALPNTQSFPLNTLSPTDARSLFEKIYEQPIAEAVLDDILGGIAYHTQMIEMLAAYTKEKNWTIQQLNEVVTTRGIRGLDATHINAPNEDAHQSIHALLRSRFLMDLPDAYTDIMRYMSIMPTVVPEADAWTMSAAQLHDYFEAESDLAAFTNALNALAALRWLTRYGVAYGIHPIIKESVFVQLEPNSTNCQKLIQSFTKWLVPNEEIHEPMLNRAPFGLIGEEILKGVFSEGGNFGEDDKAVALLALRLDWLFRDLGQLNKALDYSLKMVAIRDAVLPSEHTDLATSYSNLAVTYGALGQNDKRLDYNLKALAIREKGLPAEHPDWVASYNNLAVAYGSLGQHDKALEYNLKALAIWNAVLPAEHPDLARSYSNLAETYRALGQHDKSLDYNLKALAIQEKFLPAEHPDLATSYNNLALTYGALGQHDKALEYNLKALAIQEKVLPAEHPDLAQSYSNLSATYGALGQHDKQLDYNLKALAIREKVLPAEHPNLALSYNNLAWTYYNLGDLSKAVGFMKKAVTILSISLPPTHPNLLTAKKSLAFFEDKLGEEG